MNKDPKSYGDKSMRFFIYNFWSNLGPLKLINTKMKLLIWWSY